MSETLGARVRRLRLALHLTQDQLGEAVGCSESWVCRIEGDHYGSNGPSAGRVADLAVVLDVTMDQLWYGEAREPHA